ncbi:MAG TPA: metallophosphoesterase family protein [Candidatus Hydrogenedentes bacterium]|nr:metallophosphoesterase family protein [Candidatus Hydrogenedentota bacterium]HOL77810.1 metallophosphoesterase family protein [Candidatus Hydrogenedentota bacterium]HPO86872.1 metallophosphoesterase family protein [Candidatus Hydrogenedentota bacterium]
MRYAIISDLHANLEALQAVLNKIDTLGIDQVVCLGDVVGYNASPNECVDIVKERNIPTVCGNHDAVACGLEEPWGFNPVALSAALWTRDHLTPENQQWLRELPVNRSFEHFLASHGTPMDRDFYLFAWEDALPYFDYVSQLGHRVCFFGHTHCPAIFSLDGSYGLEDDSTFKITDEKMFFINPGSVGQPRDGDPRAAFGILDTDRHLYELVRVEYPVEQAAERIIASKLPHFLAQRLHLGR